ncbi:MAG TPA: hypothetical protein VNZ64_25655 [Candidatus Acidoferrum sp.]|jgi:hypothetical protein|nr:hypothetical protein [Candidatus Acidoferrum sp.]
MNETSARPTDSKESADARKPDQEVESLDTFIKQIEDRASAQTQVLLGVLEREEKAHWRHWGINE